jgi:hypothetical protein
MMALKRTTDLFEATAEKRMRKKTVEGEIVLMTTWAEMEMEEMTQNPAQADGSRDEIDPRTFYGYLFEQDKQPSKVLDAMLRSITRYIARHCTVCKREALTLDL